MAGYYIKRLVFSLLLILGVVVLTYLLIYIAPGNPAYVWAGKPRGSKASEAVSLAEKELGLDKPLYVQVALFTFRVIRGDWGLSIAFKQPVSEIIFRALRATLELLLFSYIIAIPSGTALGVFMALRRGSLVDLFLKLSSSILVSVPRFWLALLLLLSFSSLGMGVSGRVSATYLAELRELTGFYLLDSLIMLRLDIFLDVLLRLLPPALVVSVYPALSIARYVRYNLSECLYEDYVMEAISLGLPRGVILSAYALRGSIPGVVQLAGMNFVYSFVEASVVEYIFMREGIGRVLVEGIIRSDYPLVIATFFVISTLLIAVNTLVDLVQRKLDPRVRI